MSNEPWKDLVDTFKKLDTQNKFIAIAAIAIAGVCMIDDYFKAEDRRLEEEARAAREKIKNYGKKP